MRIAATSLARDLPAKRTARREFYHDATAPRPNSLRPTAFAIVRDNRGWLLLVRRCDNGNWELPGGRVEFGESAEEAAIREVAEECGLLVAPTRLAGVYSDPEHVMVYPDSAEVRQQFAVCFHADFLSGTPRPDRVETSDAAWIDPRRLSELAIHPSIRLRINDAVTDPDNPHHR